MTVQQPVTTRSVAFSILVGLASLAILLQGFWAGIFMDRDLSRSTANNWVNVHSAGAYVALVLAVAATIVAALQLRARKDLIIGAAVLGVLLVVEIGIGSAIDKAHALTIVHVPLALAIMAVAVWLPLRTRNRG
jgi:heme A synthase